MFKVFKWSKVSVMDSPLDSSRSCLLHSTVSDFLRSVVLSVILSTLVWTHSLLKVSCRNLFSLRTLGGCLTNHISTITKNINSWVKFFSKNGLVTETEYFVPKTSLTIGSPTPYSNKRKGWFSDRNPRTS